MLTVLASMAAPALALVFAFVSGVIAGSSTGHWAQSRRRQIVLALVTVLFVVAAFLNAAASSGPALLVLASAMGALHGVLEDVPAAFIGFLESIGRLGEKLATAVTGGPVHGWVNDLLRWTGLVTGIAAGLILYPLFGLGGAWLAAAIAGLCAVMTAMSGRELPLLELRTLIFSVSRRPQSNGAWRAPPLDLAVVRRAARRAQLWSSFVAGPASMGILWLIIVDRRPRRDPA